MNPSCWVMLDIPSQYMHYCIVLLLEAYCVIVQGLGIIVVFFVTSLETCYHWYTVHRPSCLT